jgi:hypothetical protein
MEIVSLIDGQIAFKNLLMQLIDKIFYQQTVLLQLDGYIALLKIHALKFFSGL